MAAEEDKGNKIFQKAIAGTSTPVLLCPPATRLHGVWFNEGPSPVRLGTPSGTVSSQGILLPSGMYFYDYYSDDDWWMQAVGAGSGTVSGFIVEGL